MPLPPLLFPVANQLQWLPKAFLFAPNHPLVPLLPFNTLISWSLSLDIIPLCLSNTIQTFTHPTIPASPTTFHDFNHKHNTYTLQCVHMIFVITTKEGFVQPYQHRSPHVPLMLS